MSTTPAQASEVSPDWLNGHSVDDIGVVADITFEHIGEGVGVLGEVARLHLTYEDGHTGPATAIVKCQSLYPDNVVLAQMMGFYEREVNFYRELAGSLQLRVPKLYAAKIDAGGAPFVLVIEEIVGATMVDQIEGANRDQAEQVIATLAQLHAAFWDNDRLHSLTWLPPMNNDLYKGSGALAEANWDGFVEKWADRVPAEMVAACEELTPRYAAMSDFVASLGPQTFAHTDPRADNVLLGGSAGDGAVVLLDYQLSCRHLGAWDVAYFISQSLTADDRHAWSDDLTSLYLSELSERGVTGYSSDELTTHMRYCLMHQAWSQIAVSNLDPGNDRGRQLLDAMLSRSFQAAHEAGGPELLSAF